jgi:hypothetical protein
MLENCKTLEEYISRYQVDGVMWKAQKLLGDLPETDIRRNDNVIMIANTLALIPQPVMRDDYAQRICREHNLKYKTIEKLIADATVIQKRKEESRKTVRKNKVQKLEDVNTFPFFVENVTVNTKTHETTFKGIKFDKYKFVQLLAHFGFTRYETGEEEKDDFNFVRLKDNVITMVTRNQIIDHVEQFVKADYDFAGAGCEHSDSEILINAFYDQIRVVFSKDLFARVRTEEKIIINRDTKDTCYLYYENGFVEITKEGWKLKNYSEMEGSVWEHQMLQRSFTAIPIDSESELSTMGYFADFCFRVANQDAGRFKALCSLIGYLIHDFYETVLKAVLITDSSLSEASEGRTGKTLLAKVIGQVRSYCEINGKDFDSSDKNKYEDAKLGTQVIHLNDVKNRGRNKFEFEDVFNDVTEGYVVNAKYMTPFRGQSKFMISTNKTLNIVGASQRDRIIEFEMSTFFGEHLRPSDYYGHWFIRDWNEEEFNRFDNFMCYCSQMFFRHGLLEPAAINLGERKLMNHTALEFLEFMDEITLNLKQTGVPWGGYNGVSTASLAGCELHEFAFDKRKLYEKFLHDYTDFKAWLAMRTFTTWLRQYAEIRLHVKHCKEWKSNGCSMIRFITDDSKPV